MRLLTYQGKDGSTSFRVKKLYPRSLNFELEKQISLRRFSLGIGLSDFFKIKLETEAGPSLFF